MKKPIFTLLCALCVTVSAFPQQKPQEAVVHENRVSPSKNDAYRAAIKKIKDHCTRNKVRMMWNTLALEDNSYIHLLPVEGKASHDSDQFADLKKIIGVDTFDALIAEMNDGVQSRVQSISIAMPEHGYLDPLPEERYRQIFYVFPLQGKAQAMEDLFMEWRNTYTSHNAKENYHVYRVNFADEQGYVITMSAKDPADMERKRSETRELMGGALSDLWKRQLAMTKKYYWKRGWVVPALSYAYQEELAEK